MDSPALDASARPLGALVELGRLLRARDYQFVTVTPETHRRVLARRSGPASCLRDVFGWSLPFRKTPLVDGVFELLVAAGALLECDEGYRSAVRFSSLSSHLFAHSAYPTTDAAAVFFGPDTYRFCTMLTARLGSGLGRVVDVGCGTGAGGIVLEASARAVVLADINDDALRFARVNVALAGATNVEVVQSDVLGGVGGPIDLLVANPPYMADEQGRVYRDGGGSLGEGLAVRIVAEGLQRLEAGGRLLLYTGSPIVAGSDTVRKALLPVLDRAGASFVYEELDPDVFGEELERTRYASAERIAVVALDATRRREKSGA